MDEKQVKEVLDGVTAAIAKEVPEIVESKVAEAMAKQASDIEAIKTELKAAQVSAKSAPEVKAAFAKTAVVSIMKDVIANNVTSEKAFDAIVQSTVKAMTEGTATDGAELVFDQFESDILRVINSFEVINSVRILNLAKGDTLKLPKATNGVTTYYTDEGADATESEATTAFVTFDIAKMTTLTDMTEELLDDTMTIPDLYDLIVEFIGESQAEFLEEKIIGGLDTEAIVGITKTTGVNTVSLAATETSEDLADSDIVSVITSIGKKYGKNKKWVMSTYIHGRIMAIKTTDGYPLYPEMRSATPTLMGAPVIISDASGLVQNVSGDTSTKVLAIYGDLSRYTYVRRKGVTLEQGYYGDNWKKGIKSLKSTQRGAGQATFPAALTLLKNGAAS